MIGFDEVWLHAGQRPDAVDARLSDALQSRRLPSRLLYDSHAQAGRWLRYHEVWSPARTDPRVEALYPTLGGRRMKGRTLVSLGCGGGRKDLAILQAAGARRYFAVDTSVALAAGSAARASEAGFDATAVVMDLQAPAERAAFGEEPVVFAALGLVPNFELEALGATLRRLLQPGDGLMLSANLGAAEDPEILLQYDNPESRAWMLGALAELGLPPDAVSMDVRGRRRDDVLSRIEAQVRLRRSVEVRLPFHHAEWAAGTELEVLFSNRLQRKGAGERVAEAVGLPLVDEEDTEVEAVFWLESPR